MDLNNQRTAFYANSQRGECVLLADLQSYSISHYTVESILHFEEMVEALQFAVTATQNGTETKEVSQAQRALSSVLAGVNKLRDLGMSHAEIIDHIGAYIDIRWEHDTPLQSLRENPDRPQETRRNQRSQGGKREQLFSENEDIRDFRGRFWLAFWEASYEKGRPRVEREEHIELLLHSIPAVLHGSKGPMSQVELCDKFQFANRRNPRVRDAIVRAACTILLDRSSGQPRDIVEVGATCRLWTRQHAVVAGLMIASRPQGRNVSGPVRNSSGA
jgi:hypothetical protein